MTTPDEIEAERARVRRLLAPLPPKPPSRPPLDTSPEPVPVPLAPGELVEANDEGIARLLALHRDDPPAPIRKPRQTQPKPKPVPLRTFD
jgi:hypothetical protein